MDEVNDASIPDVDVKPFEALLEEEDAPEYVNVNQISHIKVELVEDDCKETQEPKEIYQCDICTNKYKKTELLELHRFVHSTQCICPVCYAEVSPRKEFIKHINQHIRDKIKESKIVLICSFCEKHFTTKRRLNIHLRVHTNERPHKCDICGEGFKQPGTLKAHQVTHTKEKPYVCEICNGSYTTSSSLKRHKKKLHDKGKTLNCKHCEARFFNMTDFRSHKREKHPNKVYNKCCPYCFVTLNSRFSYRKHREFHKEDKLFNSASGYVCMLCGKKSNGWGAFLAHRRMHMKYSYEEFREGKQKKSLQCKLCSKAFTNTNSLFKHMEVHMKEKIKCKLCPNYFSYFRLKVHVQTMHQKLNCQVCNTVINGKDNILKHYKKYHPNVKKKYVCKICGKLYKFKAMLDIHFTVMHEGKAIKNFKCTICERRFLTKLTMDHHLAVAHDKKSQYKCHPCDVDFDTPKEFLLHKSTHDRKQSVVKLKNASLKPKTPRKRFQCKVCKKIFHSSINYKFHVTNKTCVNFLKMAGKNKCAVCDRILSSKGGLARHMSIHSNVDNACRYCDKKFKVKDSLRTHIKKHHPGKKVYWCQSCGQGFDKCAELSKHTKEECPHRVKTEYLDENADSFLEIKVEPDALVKEEPQLDLGTGALLNA